MTRSFKSILIKMLNDYSFNYWLKNQRCNYTDNYPTNVTEGAD